MSEYKYNIKKIYKPSPDQVILQTAKKDGSPVFNFKPGQYAMISYKNNEGKNLDKHAFSIASSPTQKANLDFAIKIQGSFTQGLLLLKEGDEIIISGPYGDFIYDEKKYLDVVMIAGGIGITPFFSALNYASDLNLTNRLSIIYSCRNKNCATYYNEIRELAARNKNISSLFSFTDEVAEENDINIIHKRIDANIINKFIGSVNGKTFFICGPDMFMKSMVDNLISLGVKKRQIKMEEFSMIPDNTLKSRLRNFSYSILFASILFIISYILISKPNIWIGEKEGDSTKIESSFIDGIVLPISQEDNIAPSSTLSLPIITKPSQIVAPVSAPINVPAPRTHVS